VSSNRGRIDGKSVTRHKPERVTWHQGRGAGDGVGMRSSVASKCPRTAQTAGGVATEHRRFGNVKIIAYIRVSTSEQVDSGAGLEAQRSSISAEATRRGWTQVEYIEDAGFSAGSMNRPGLAAALTALEHGEAQLLVVAKMDRLSRSVLDFASIMQKAQREGWVLLALDSPADLTTPGGEAMAGVMAVFAQLERRFYRAADQRGPCQETRGGGHPRATAIHCERCRGEHSRVSKRRHDPASDCRASGFRRSAYGFGRHVVGIIGAPCAQSACGPRPRFLHSPESRSCVNQWRGSRPPAERTSWTCLALQSLSTRLPVSVSRSCVSFRRSSRSRPARSSGEKRR